VNDRGVETKKRQEKLKELILRLHEGASEEVIKEEFTKHFQTISPLEISVMERKLMKEEGLSAQEIMRLCNVHVAVMVDYVEDPENIPDDFQKPGHPVHVLKEENLALEAALMRIRNLLEVYVQTPDDEIKKGLQLQIDLLWDFDKHYTRKETSFFPIMEKYGNTAPPQVMWGVDDQIREQYKIFKAAFEADQFHTMLPLFSEFEYEMQEMFVKEENILIPMVSEIFTEEDWLAIADEMDDIGYCIVSPLAKWQPKRREKVEKAENSNDRLQLGLGTLSVKELNQILDVLPLELTFVDVENVVQYYNNHPDEKLLPRTPSAIGRDVMSCHPPKVHETVCQLISDLREGIKDIQHAWYQKEETLIYITYTAVRDAAGEFQGILEYVQDITELSTIQGENREVNR
jgi:hypothetical protein